MYCCKLFFMILNEHFLLIGTFSMTKDRIQVRQNKLFRSSGFGSAARYLSTCPISENPDQSSGGGTATKNFFMDIYAKELSKMQSVSKSSATTKKRNFDATQFNTYGLPLGKFWSIKIHVGSSNRKGFKSSVLDLNLLMKIRF